MHKSRWHIALAVVFGLIAVIAVMLLVAVGVACNGQSGFSCGG